MNTATISTGQMFEGAPELIGAVVTPQRITLSYRARSNMMLTSNPPVMAPDRVWQEFYEPRKMSDGSYEIERVGKREGRHWPAQSMPERFEFPSA